MSQSSSSSNSGFIAHIVVTPRRDVLDPQGAAVQGALASLGFEEASNVRIGRFVQLEIRAADRAQAQARVAEMCDKLLANPVVEDFRFELLDASTQGERR